MQEKVSDRLVREVAEQEAEEQAARLGHDIGNWRDCSTGRRGQCRNRDCFAHIIISGEELKDVSSLTSLKRKCPYRASRPKQPERKVPRF